MPNQTPAQAAQSMIQTYGDMLFRLCLVMLRNEMDAEDAVQDVVVKYLQKAPCFESPQHERAWLIRVASNQCRDRQRYARRHPQIGLDELQRYVQCEEHCGILEALLQVEEKFRLVLVLYYVEEYPMHEIARMLGKSVSAVKMRLQKGRRLLEAAYRKEFM